MPNTLSIPNETLLQNIFLQSSNVIAITNANFNDLKFEHVNPAFLEMTGYTIDEIIGKNPKILQGPRTKRDMTKRLKESCLKGEAFRGDNINYKKDGSEYYVGWTVTPIKDENGKIINFLSIQKDITKIKKLEEDKLKAQKLQALNKISAGLTHELNTALTNFKGSLEMMDMEILNLPACDSKGYLSDDIKDVKKGVDYVQYIVSSLHYLTNKEFDLTQEVNVSEVLLETIDKLRSKIKKTTACKINSIDIFNQEFTLEALYANVDRKSLVHLFTIIIDNALDELIKKEDISLNNLDISISKDTAISIDFTDNAGGIDKEVQETIFDPLSQNKELGGLGIGLYVAKRISEGNNAKIDVVSNKPNTTFKIEL